MMIYLQGVFISAMIVYCLYQIIEKKLDILITEYFYYLSYYYTFLWYKLMNYKKKGKSPSR